MLPIPKIPETELLGNAGQARIPRILFIPSGMIQFPRSNSQNSNNPIRIMSIVRILEFILRILIIPAGIIKFYQLE